jgi:hypothetical protein
MKRELKKGEKMKKIYNRKFITGVSACVSILFLMLPLTICAEGTCVEEPPSTPKIGISWITEYTYWADLPYCDDDAEGLMDTLMDDPNTNWDDGFETTEQNVHDEQWEIYSDQNYVDNVHFAYYAGHGWESGTGRRVLVFKSNFLGIPIDSADIHQTDQCDWGDENSRMCNWVGLACCEVGDKIQNALEGVHLICGWTTYCADKAYGPTLADKFITYQKTVKNAWFETGDDLGDSGTTMRVVAEDISNANDHIYGYGAVYCDPVVDSTYYSWTYTV